MRHANYRLSAVAMAVALAGMIVFAGGVQAAQPSGPGVQVFAKGSVNQVVKQLTKMVGGSGMMVMGELHQGKVLEMTGMKVQSESLFIGNPTVGKKLFGAHPGAGLVVPVRINVYKNTDGQTVVSYIPPSQALAGFHDPMMDQVAAMLDGKLQKMVGMLPR